MQLSTSIKSSLIPTRNEGHYIRECLTSILSVTSEELEVIVSDNNSKDCTLKVLSEFDDDRLCIITNETDLTILENLQLCVTEAKGRFILFLGGDDYIKPDALISILPLLTEQKIYTAPLECFSDRTKEIIELQCTPKIMTIIGNHPKNCLSEYLNNINHDELSQSIFPRQGFPSLDGLTTVSNLSAFWYLSGAIFSGTFAEKLSIGLIRKRYQHVKTRVYWNQKTL